MGLPLDTCPISPKPLLVPLYPCTIHLLNELQVVLLALLPDEPLGVADPGVSVHLEHLSRCRFLGTLLPKSKQFATAALSLLPEALEWCAQYLDDFARAKTTRWATRPKKRKEDCLRVIGPW